MSDRLTPTQHYQTAQVLLANLRDEMAGRPGVPLRTREQQTLMIAEANVHALLALTGAVLGEIETVDPDALELQALALRAARKTGGA